MADDFVATTADGMEHHFPAGTDPAIVHGAIQNYLSQKQIQPSPAQPSMMDKLIQFGKNSINPVVSAVGASPYAEAGATIGTAIAPGPGTLIGGAAGELGGYFLNDQILKRTEKAVGSNIANTNGDTSVSGSAKDALINLIANKTLGAVWRGAKAFTGDSSVLKAADKGISDLGGTVSSYFKNGSIPKAIEDLFAPAAKKAALQDSGKLANDAITDEASKLSGRAASVVNQPTYHGDVIQQQISNALDNSNREVALQTGTANSIAKANVIPAEFDNFGRPTRYAEGPINPTSSLQKASGIVSDSMKSVVPASPEQQALINKASVLTSGKGPLSFSDAWNLRSQLDEFGSPQSLEAELSPAQTTARELSSALNDDMEQSMAQWKNDPNRRGLTAYKNAVDTINQRQQYFFNQGSDNILGDIIKNNDSNLPALDRLIGDSNQLLRAKNAGTVKFPSGKVQTDNFLPDLGAYNLIRMRNAAKIFDPQSGQFTINAQKLLDTWNDPAFQESKGILYNATQRGNYDQLFKNIAMTQQKMGGVSSNSKLWLSIRGAMYLAPGLVGSFGSLAHGMELAGVELSGHAMGKMMSNPKVARGLIAMAQGMPLSMSDQTFARLASAAVQGSAMTLIGKDGSRNPGGLDRDGNFVSDDDSVPVAH